MLKKIDITKLIKRLILLIILLSIVGIFVANKVVQRNGYDGLSDFVSNYKSNKKLATQADPTKLNIQLSDDDFAFLENKRQEALDRGIQINIGDNYVDCEISTEDTKIDAEIRLKGHMTDHLEGDKWSFRVKSDEEILGMYRFSLQHPGTRNYAYEWVYHQLLKEEGIIYLNYDFVQVQLRDKDLGIYALEEHFGQHVVERNNRPPGAILRWNPNLYWEWRIDELDGVYLDEQYSAYMSSFAEPYDRGTVEKDTVLLNTYLKGAALLEAFRKGEKITSEVFDVELMAKFHAVIDLVGGHHSLDWSDVKFFYNSESGKIEPVGYESFSVRKTERIAGQRIPDSYAGISQDYHDQLFADPIFYKAYIENLQRICNEDYFSQFVRKIKPEHEQKLAILALEWPHRKFSFDPYFENIELIRHNLELPKPFHAFLENKTTDSTLVLSIAPVSDYPIELIELEIDGKEEIKIPDVILPPKARNEVATYIHLKFNHQSKKIKNLVLKARIPGGQKKFKIEVAERPLYDQKIGANSENRQIYDLTDHPDISYNKRDSSYFFDAMDIVVDKHYFIDKGKVLLLPGQHLSFADGTISIINAAIQSIGTSDQQISISTEDDSQFFLIDNSVAQFNNTVFLGGNTGIVSKNAQLMLEHCVMADTKMTFVQSSTSALTFSNCQMGSVKSLGTFDRSTVKLSGMKAKKGNTFITSFGSNVNLVSCEIEDYELVFDLDQLSILKSWSINMDNNLQIAAVSSGSDLTFLGGNLGKAEKGFEVEKEDEFGAESSLRLYRTQKDGVKKLRF